MIVISRPQSQPAATPHRVTGAVMVNDARVVKADIAASNGIIHVIDTVIMPGDTK